MNKINLSCDWNKKLACDWFTIISLKDKFKITEKVQIDLNGKYACEGFVMNKTDYKMNQLTINVCALCMGYGVEETQTIIKRLFPNIPWNITPIYFYLIKKIKTDSQKTLGI